MSPEQQLRMVRTELGLLGEMWRSSHYTPDQKSGMVKRCMELQDLERELEQRDARSGPER